MITHLRTYRGDATLALASFSYFFLSVCFLVCLFPLIIFVTEGLTP